MRRALVSALVACAESPKASARRFLCGLSADELRFIADYVGACIIERQQNGEATRLEDFQRTFERCTQSSDDLDLKMILLLEYLSRCGLAQRAVS